MHSDSPQDISFLFRLGLALAYVPSTIGVILLPVMVGALGARGIASNILGFLGFLEFGGTALGAFAGAAIVKRLGALPICAVGGCLMLAGNLLSVFSMGDLHMLFIGRAISGFGSGLALSGAVAEVARTGLGASSYGLMIMAVALSSACSYLIGPYLIDVDNGRGVFFLNAGFGALLLVTVFLLARHAPREVADEQPQSQSADSASGIGTSTALVILALAAATYLIYAMGEISLWTFAMSLGQSYGLSLQAISHLMVFVMIGASMPPLLAGWVESRIGLGKGIAICIVAMVFSNLMLVSRFWEWGFAIFLPIRFAFQALIVPLLLALFAKSDPSGRAVAAASGSANIGVALAPLAAGYMVDLPHNSYVFLGIFSSMLLGVALILALVLVRRSAFGLRSAPEIAQPVAAS